MRSDFFEKFPELRQDIPAFNPPLLNTGMLLSLRPPPPPPPPNVHGNGASVVNHSSAFPESDEGINDLGFPFGIPPVAGQVDPMENVDTPDWPQQSFDISSVRL